MPPSNLSTNARAQEWNLGFCDFSDGNTDLELMTRLSFELSLLKKSLENYQKFDETLGDKVSGPHHYGSLDKMFATVLRMRDHTISLNAINNPKRSGTFVCSETERIANEVIDEFNRCYKPLFALMREKVDMSAEEERGNWVSKKTALLGGWMGKVMALLEELDKDGLMAREVQDMRDKWSKTWTRYSGMDTQGLKELGLILRVDK